jgi:hypothetical protein
MRRPLLHKRHRQPRAPRRALPAMMFLCIIGSACSSTAPPPVTVNTPPTIDSVAFAGDRAEADEPIAVTATVRDAETPLSMLTYTWTAAPQPGTFTGDNTNGSAVLWRPPKGQKTPDIYTVTLTVSEAYTSAGQAKQNSVSKSATVHYNDSPGEVAFLGRDFLVTKFGDFNVSPADAVSNFSDSCQGKADERADVTNNRANFHILSASFIPSTISFNPSRTSGTVEGACQFEDMPNSGPNAGRREFVSGICDLTTVYENFRWLLCTSTFEGTRVDLASLKGRVPGQLISSVRKFE